MNEEAKTKILNIIRKEQYPIEAINISKKANINLKDTYKILNKLEVELKVKVNKKNKYIAIELVTGKIRINNKGFGFVSRINNEDIYINKSNLRNSSDGDNVVVEIINKKNNEGKVVKILSSNKNTEVGQLVVIDNIKYIKLDDVKKKNKILYVDDLTENLLPGHKVSVKIGSLYKKNIYYAKDIKLIGHINDPKVDILSKAIVYDIHTEFPEEVIKEINQIPTEVSQEEIINRKDLRNLNIFSIDGEDAKDLDDAVSIEILPNGNFLLGVHIAAVDYYVKENSAIDKEACKRGTSCYFPGLVIPLLHPKLSNGICSLSENSDRLTTTTLMEIDKNCNLINYDIFDSVINSKKRMTYIKAEDCLKDNNQDSAYEPFIKDLKTMKSLSDIIRKKRNQNGCIKFEIDEMKLIVDSQGNVIDVTKKERLDSQKIIEDFMIFNNVTVASHINNINLPFIYRTHGTPIKNKLDDFLTFARIMNERTIRLPQNLHCKAINEILESLKDSPNYEIYSKLLLRSMKKAIYEVNNTGHFGLALENYTHFTSPIRRYPDLLVHRLLHKYKEKDYKFDKEQNEKELVFLDNACKHASLKEQNADKCEKEINKMKIAEYMDNHIGEIYTGKITEVSKTGFYVDIYNGIEGFVKISDLNKGYFDKKTYTIYGNNQRFMIGDKIEVTINGTIKELGYVNLSLTNIPENNIELKKTLKIN